MVWRNPHFRDFTPWKGDRYSSRFYQGDEPIVECWKIAKVLGLSPAYVIRLARRAGFKWLKIPPRFEQSRSRNVLLATDAQRLIQIMVENGGNRMAEQVAKVQELKETRKAKIRAKNAERRAKTQGADE